MIKRALKSFWLWVMQDPDTGEALDTSGYDPRLGMDACRIRYPSDEPFAGFPTSAPMPDGTDGQLFINAARAAPQEAEPMSLLSVASSLVAKLQAVAALLPLLTSLVQTVEATLPAGTAGATKLKAVEDALASVYEKEQIAQTSFSEVWPLLSGVASTLVATFKATGTFTSAASTTTTAAAAK